MCRAPEQRLPRAKGCAGLGDRVTDARLTPSETSDGRTELLTQRPVLLRSHHVPRQVPLGAQSPFAPGRAFPCKAGLLPMREQVGVLRVLQLPREIRTGLQVQLAGDVSSPWRGWNADR